MPKFNKSKKGYNLNSSFVANAPDITTHDYDVTASEKLVTWIRMENSTSPNDLGPYKLSPVYENTPVKGTARLGNKSYPAVTLSDSSNTSVQVTSTSGHLSFTSLASGGTPTATSDQPFSISFWFKVEALPGSGHEYLVSKSKTASSADYEYRVTLYTGGLIFFQLSDEVASANPYVVTNTGSVSAGKWHHITCTYDGRGTATAYNGMKVYIDGVDASLARASNGGTYVGMQPYWAGILYIGGYQAGTTEFDGSLSEFALWSDELTSKEVQAVYNGTKYGTHEIISGYLNNPPRILLQEKDNHTGSYPTIARTGDPDFTGRGKIHFDDTKTIEFRGSYATAEIDFLSVPSGGDSIVLFRAKSGNPIQFDFLRGENTKPSSSDHQGVSIAGAEMTVEKVAAQFALAVESSMPTMEARVNGSKVNLRYHPVSTGLTVGSALITSSSFSPFNPLKIKVKEFSQLGPTNYVYPLMLDENSIYLNKRTAAPNSFGVATSISGPGLMKPGVSDVGISFTPGESLSPFNESRISIEDTEFYKVGTDPKVLPGFSERLSSKTSFSVSIDPAVSTEIFFSTGSSAVATVKSDINSGLSYYNFKNKKWDIIGNLTTGSNVDYLNSSTVLLTGSMLSIAPSSHYSAGDNIDRIATQGALGKPDPVAGFPVATKFNATSDQVLKMSDYITGPFLLEKFTIEVSGTLGTAPMLNKQSATDDDLRVGLSNTVVLLNQFKTPIDKTFSSHFLLSTGSSPAVPMKIAQFQKSTRNKDIILYGKVITYVSGVDGTSFQTYKFTESEWAQSPKSKPYDRAYPVSVSSNTGPGGLPTTRQCHPRYFHTGTISLELVPKSLAQSEFCTYTLGTRTHPGPSGDGSTSALPNTGTPASTSTRKWSFGVSTPGRNLHGLSSGRSYIKGVTGAKIIDETASSNFTPASQIWKSDDLRSPYLIMPTDELVLAWVNQPFPDPGDRVTGGSNEGPSESFAAHTMRTKLSPGKGKITFYGTQISDHKPVSFELNQPLTSDAIHEDIRDDFSPYGESRCLDQFDVDPVTSFRKSYLDNIIVGTENVADQYLSAAPVDRTARQVVATVSAGQAGITGSLQRFVRIPDNNLTYYDSTAPSIWSYVNFHQIGQYGQNRIVLWDPSPGSLTVPEAQRSTVGSMTWPMAFPFEGAMGEVKRKNSVKGMVTDHTGSTVSPDFRTYMSGAQTRPGVAGYELYMDALHNAYDPSTTVIPDSQSLMYFFGFGDRGVSGKTASREVVNDASAYKRSLMGYGKMASTFMSNQQSIADSQLTLTIDNVRIAPRGTKYGLINSYPHSPASVFRYDAYGQFRDRLEQGYYTRFYEQGILSDSPISVTFVDRDGDRGVDPLNTNSQNLSLFSTSSVPYFDGLSKERSNLEPDLVKESQVTISFD